jgi:hypothetical protein
MPSRGKPVQRFRVTIAGLMLCVLYLGFALAALTNPTPLWAEAWLTAALAVLAVAVLGAIYSGQRHRRVFWGGFAIVGGGFMALNLFPANPPHLLPWSLMDGYYRTLSYHPGFSDETVWVSIGREFQEARSEKPFAGDPAGRYRFTIYRQGALGPLTGMLPAAAFRAIGPDGYQRLGQSILAIPLGIVGGLVARRFAAGREETGDGENFTGTPPHE